MEGVSSADGPADFAAVFSAKDCGVFAGACFVSRHCGGLGFFESAEFFFGAV